MIGYEKSPPKKVTWMFTKKSFNLFTLVILSQCKIINMVVFSEFFSLGNFGNGRRRQNQSQWKYPKDQAGIKAAPERVQSYSYHLVPNYWYKHWFEGSKFFLRGCPCACENYVSLCVNFHGVVDPLK